MRIDVEDHAGVKVLRLAGELDSEKDLVEVASDWVSERGARLVLDMQDVSHMNSIGLGGLVRLAAQANIHEGRVILASPSPFVAGVLEATKLETFFEVAPSVEEALKRLG